MKITITIFTDTRWTQTGKDVSDALIGVAEEIRNHVRPEVGRHWITDEQPPRIGERVGFWEVQE